MEMGSILFIVLVAVGCLLIVVGAAVSTPAADYPLRDLSRKRNKDQLNAELICAKIEYYRAKTKALKGDNDGESI